MSGKSALIIGATGAVGKPLLLELLGSPAYARVGEFGRRVTPAAALPAAHAGKLVQTQIDFDKLDAADLRSGQWDTVFITLGTTRADAGSAEAFERIDREYVIAAARAAKSDAPEHKQTLIYVSTSGANPSSPFLYAKSKGLTEIGLASLGYSDTIVFQPGFLVGAQRAKTRLAESVFGPLAGLFSHISDSAAISVSALAKSMRVVGEMGATALPAGAGATKAGPTQSPFWIIANKGALFLAK